MQSIDMGTNLLSSNEGTSMIGVKNVRKGGLVSPSSELNVAAGSGDCESSGSEEDLDKNVGDEHGIRWRFEVAYGAVESVSDLSLKSIASLAGLI